MHFVRMAAVGLFVGVLARFFYPGAVSLGLVGSTILGIAGSFVAGFLGQVMHRGSAKEPFHPAGILFSILGAMVLIFLAHNAPRLL